MFDDGEFIDGLHELERDEIGPFVWTSASFRLRARRAASFARLELCYLGQDGTLEVRRRGESIDRVPLARGWHACPVRLEAAAGEVLELRVNPIVDVPSDSRQLGIMLRRVELFEDARLYETRGAAAVNLQLNDRECRAGVSRLESLPPLVRINMETRCNIPETGAACSYCAWDWAKDSERGSPAFQLDTLDELGDFYRCAVHVNDCSVGEPAMHKDFGAIVARIDADGKQLSLTSNGQLLSPRRRREMLGKNLRLYVSLDAATAEGYARYRNERFDDIIANLTALCRDKKDHGDLPRVHVAFIAMRSNKDEIPQFIALMREVGIDEIKLRSLYVDDNVGEVSTRAGHRFDYAQELLTMEELLAVGSRARAVAQKVGVPLIVEIEEFPQSAGASQGPICSEPWRTMYVLRRGIMPCCYATEPIATWNQQQGRPLDEFLQDVFNGQLAQEMRSELAAGRLHDYCQRTSSCPILQQMQRAGLIEVPSSSLYQLHVVGQPASPEPVTLPMVPLERLHVPRRKAA